MRRSSPTFKKWVGVYLSADNHRQLWVPPGFAHGFYVTSDSAQIVYKCTDYYAPEHERTVRWNDLNLAINWPLVDGHPPQLSNKDAQGTDFRAAEVFV